jgi:hypothetical protein
MDTFALCTNDIPSKYKNRGVRLEKYFRSGGRGFINAVPEL